MIQLLLVYKVYGFIESLSIMFPVVPQIITSVSSDQVYVGDYVSLSCIPSQGQFLISWAFNDTILNCDDSTLCSMGAYGTTLNLFNVQHTGSYTCSLIVGSQIILSETITVTVREGMV